MKVKNYRITCKDGDAVEVGIPIKLVGSPLVAGVLEGTTEIVRVAGWRYRSIPTRSPNELAWLYQNPPWINIHQSPSTLNKSLNPKNPKSPFLLVNFPIFSWVGSARAAWRTSPWAPPPNWCGTAFRSCRTRRRGRGRGKSPSDIRRFLAGKSIGKYTGKVWRGTSSVNGVFTSKPCLMAVESMRMLKNACSMGILDRYGNGETRYLANMNEQYMKMRISWGCKWDWPADVWDIMGNLI